MRVDLSWQDEQKIYWQGLILLNMYFVLKKYELIYSFQNIGEN